MQHQDLIQSLEALCQTPWQEIWAQGGTLRRFKDAPPGVYSSPVVIGSVRGRHAIGAKVHDTSADLEVLELWCAPALEIGTEESERFFRPRRQVVKSFPTDLPLSKVLNRAILDAGLYGGRDTEARTPKGLVLRTDSCRLLLGVDERVPESLEVTTSADYIDGWLPKRELLWTTRADGRRRSSGDPHQSGT